MRRLNRWVLATGCLAAMISVRITAAQADEPRQQIRRALLVGVSTYTRTGFADRPLPFSATDMELLAFVLRENGWDVRLLISKGTKNNATRAEIIAAMDSLLDGVRGSDLVLIALSGHGQQFRATVVADDGTTVERDEAFFCPSDAEKATPATLLGMSEVTRRLGKKGGQNLVLVDACRDNPRKGGIKGVDGNAVRDLPENTSILFSCRSGQQSYETNQMYGANAARGHGVFFYRVAKGLLGDAKDSGGNVTWDSLQSYVRENVNRDALLWFPEHAVELASGARVVQQPHLIGSLIGEPPILLHVKPPSAVRQTKPIDLTGRTGQGVWVANEKTTNFTYEFQRGGVVIYRSGRETLEGTWTQNGSRVKVHVGVSSEEGTLDGKRLVLQCDTGGVGKGVATITFDEQEPNGAPAFRISGRTGNGTWIVDGKTKQFTYEFRSDGSLTYRSDTETVEGTWSQDGKTVRLQVGGSSEIGTMDGKRLVLQVENRGKKSVATVTFDD